MPSRAHRQMWRDWGRVNPLFGILTDPRYRHGGDLDEFLATGEGTVARTMEEVDRLGLCPQRRSALDFGCGLGRLTVPLARRFDEAVGVDVSDSMVERARRLHAAVANCRFEVNEADDLRRFESGSFDLVLSLFVLQHLDTRATAEAFLAEMVRVLRPGGVLVVQLCSAVSANRRPRPSRRTAEGRRTWAGTTLRRLGVPAGVLYRTLDWVPEMTMLAIPEDQATAAVTRAGGRIVHAEGPDIDAGGTAHHTYYVTR